MTYTFPEAGTLASTPDKTSASRAFNRETVVEVTHWTDKLFSFHTTRDPSFRFESGEFAMIGLEVDGRPLLRAYSMASSSYADTLEFYSIKVPNGPLTSRLQHIAKGDTVLVGRKPTGTLLLSSLKPGKRLYLLGTGTGFAPFASIIRTPEVYEQYETVVVVEGCYTRADLQYVTRTVMATKADEFLGEAAERQLLYFAAIDGEPYHHFGRITHFIETGELFDELDLPPLDPVNDRAMICGNPGMLKDLRQMLGERGFAEGSSGEPGEFVYEKAFAER
jgi:ferredoxin--NADP+ reductase